MGLLDQARCWFARLTSPSGTRSRNEGCELAGSTEGINAVRIAPAMLAVIASVLVTSMPAAAGFVQSTAAASVEQCTPWTSRNEPPPNIAVYQVREGKVDRVDFMLY